MIKMVRTELVKLSTVPGSAYRQKLAKGGAGIVILRKDSQQPGIASISKKTGEAIISDNTPAKLYPAEAFKEAVELTAGLPYSKRKGVQLKGNCFREVASAKDEKPEKAEVIIDSSEYQKIVDNYTDKKGKLSYELLNKDLIQLTHRSSKARELIANQASVAEVRNYVVGAKFRSITGNSELTDAQVKLMAELLDEVYPKGVFKELNDDIRKSLKAAK